MDRSMWQCVGIFLTTVAIAVGLRCAYQMVPGTWLGVFAPRNTSVWELSKIALWPCVASALLYHVGRWERGSICAYLMVPAALPVALLFVYWFLRMVCGICSGLLDAVVWVCLLAAGDMMALSLRKTSFMRRGMFMVCVLVCIWTFAYTLFSLHPVDLPLFANTISHAAMAGIEW